MYGMTYESRVFIPACILWETFILYSIIGFHHTQLDQYSWDPPSSDSAKCPSHNPQLRLVPVLWPHQLSINLSAYFHAYTWQSKVPACGTYACIAKSEALRMNETRLEELTSQACFFWFFRALWLTEKSSWPVEKGRGRFKGQEGGSRMEGSVQHH